MTRPSASVMKSAPPAARTLSEPSLRGDTSCGSVKEALLPPDCVDDSSTGTEETLLPWTVRNRSPAKAARSPCWGSRARAAPVLRSYS